MIEKGKTIKNKIQIGNNSPGVSIDSELGELGSKLPYDEQPILGLGIGHDERQNIKIYDSNNLTEANNTEFIKKEYAP